MITYYHGDLLKSECNVLVNTVNCVGVMGKGIALQFKKHFPENFNLYNNACRNNEIKIGSLFCVTESNKIIVNFPTKQHWRNPSQLKWILLGLIQLKQYIEFYKWRSIAIPALGCQNGGLDWHTIKFMIEEQLKNIDCDIMIYEPLE